MKFKKGQKVVCRKTDWINGNNIKNFEFPVEYEIVTVFDTKIIENDIQLISLKEFHNSIYFPSKYFDLPDFDFAEAILKNLINNAHS